MEWMSAKTCGLLADGDVGILVDGDVDLPGWEVGLPRYRLEG